MQNSVSAGNEVRYISPKKSNLDLSKKSSHLLRLIANSLYDRECVSIKKPFFFTMGEMKIVEDWLEDVLTTK